MWQELRYFRVWSTSWLTRSCTVGAETSRTSAGAWRPHLPCRDQVRDLLMGRQACDDSHGVADVLSAAEMTGQRPPVLEVRNAVLHADSPWAVRCTLAFVHLLVPVRSVSLGLAAWRRHVAFTCLGPRSR